MKLGQHFLIDRDVTERIVRYSELKPDDRVLEIGPGQVLKGLMKKIDPKLEVRNFGSTQDLVQTPVT